MKKKTLKTVRHMLMLMKRKKAHFFKDGNGALAYTYPKDGWVTMPVIDGVALEYVSEHDDTDYNSLPEIYYENPVKKIILNHVWGE